jgi:site-specific recombinase XerD
VVTTQTQTSAEACAAYARWLEKQPLAANTRRTYAVQVAQFCAYLATSPQDAGDPLHEQHAATYAVRDYRTWLKTVHKAKPSSVNLTLAALDHFYRFLGLERPEVPREDLPQAAPRGLEEKEQIAFLRAVERCPSARDRALAHLLFYTGVRVGECAALNLDDIALSARKGLVIVRSGKGDAYREVPLNAAVRRSLDTYIKVRQAQGSAEPGLFLNGQGQRLSTRAIDLIIRGLGRAAGVALSAHTLRHTCLTTLVRNGNDLVLVAEIAGHRRLETTRRYSLPTAEDRERAMEGVHVAY